jgi:hypothetical protein
VSRRYVTNDGKKRVYFILLHMSIDASDLLETNEPNVNENDKTDKN